MPTPTRVRKLMPLRGRRTSWPPDGLATEQGDFAPNCLNVRFKFGEVRGTPGRNILSGPIAAETPWVIGQFPLLTGDIWAYMLMTTRVFRWGNGTPGTPREWHEIQPGGTVPVGTTRWTAAVGESLLFFGREADPLFSWTGVSTDPFNAVVATSGTVPQARYWEYFNGRMTAAFTFEGGNTFANRIRWAESANYLRWDETLGLGAGFLDLADERQEPIRGIKALGDRLVIFTRSSIKEMIPTGTLEPVHVLQTRTRGLGCNAPYTIASSGQQLFFMGYDRGIYSWDGTRVVEVGYSIKEELHSMTYPDQMDLYFAVVIQQRQEYWLILPSGDAFIYDYARDYWTRDTVPSITALAEVEDTSVGLIWLDMLWPWEEEHRTWNQLRGISSTAIFAGRVDGSTTVIDDSVTYDYFAIGSIMDRFLETPDFYVDDTGGNRLGTIYRLLLNYEFVNDQSFEVGASFDRGRTWHTQEVTPNVQGFSFLEFSGPHTGNTFRFRFRENNAIGAFRWRSYMYEVIDAGDYIGTSTA